MDLYAQQSTIVHTLLQKRLSVNSIKNACPKIVLISFTLWCIMYVLQISYQFSRWESDNSQRHCPFCGFMNCFRGSSGCRNFHSVVNGLKFQFKPPFDIKVKVRNKIFQKLFMKILSSWFYIKWFFFSIRTWTESDIYACILCYVDVSATKTSSQTPINYISCKPLW